MPENEDQTTAETELDADHVVDSSKVVDDADSTFPDQEESTVDDQDEPDTFPRSVVEKLRNENAKYRQRAGKADDYAKRLHLALVEKTGKLADPTDLPFDAEHLDDGSRLGEAIDELLTRKPHLASRRPIGEIGQGATAPGGTVDLAGLLRSRAN